jgi:uncharacterized protein (TIGR02118 family)
MAVTLLALFKRPEGGDDELAQFMARYRAEHLPLIAQVPGLRSTEVEVVSQKYAGDDIVVVTRMTFDDQASLDAGMASAEMRAAGRNLREIAPDMLTLVALGAGDANQAHG